MPSETCFSVVFPMSKTDIFIRSLYWRLIQLTQKYNIYLAIITTDFDKDYITRHTYIKNF